MKLMIVIVVNVFCVSVYVQRLERQTRAMDPNHYSEFCESRQLSFGKILIK